MNPLEKMAKSFPRIALTLIAVPYTCVRAFIIPRFTTHIGYHINFNFLNNSKLFGACERGFDMFNEAVGKYRKKQALAYAKSCVRRH